MDATASMCKRGGPRKYPGVSILSSHRLLKAEWAIDLEAMRARGIIDLVKSNQLVKTIETKKLYLAKRDSAAIVLVFKASAFHY